MLDLVMVSAFLHYLKCSPLSATTMAGEPQAITNGMTTVRIILCQGRGDRQMQGIWVHHGSISAKSSEVGRTGWSSLGGLKNFPSLIPYLPLLPALNCGVLMVWHHCFWWPFLPTVNMASMTLPLCILLILSQFHWSGYRLERVGSMGLEHKAVSQASLGLSSHKARAKATWLLTVPRSLRENRKQRRAVSEAKKILIKELLWFLSACGLRSAHRSQPPSPGRPCAISWLQRGPCNTLPASFQLSEIILVQLWGSDIRMNRRVVTG